MSRHRIPALVLACCALLCGGCGISSEPDIRPALGLPDGQSCEMPDLVGKSYDEALAAVGSKFVIVRRDRITGQDDDGTVLMQSEKSGSTVARGATVTLTVSTGREKADMPDCIGEDYDTAAETVRRAKLSPSLFVVQSKEEPWTVLETDPPADTRVVAGSYVQLTVSGGPDAAMNPLPAFLGNPAEDALQAAAELGVQLIFTQIESDAPAGMVLSQSVPAGTECAAGTEVRLEVSAEDTEETTNE